MRPRPTRAPKAWRPTRHWSDATINRHFAYLKHIYNLALKDGKVTRNPVAGVKLFPEVSKTRFLSDKELTPLRGVMNLKDWQEINVRFKSLIVTTSVNLALAAGAALSGAAYMNEPRPHGIDPNRIKTDPNINKSTGLTENEYRIHNENAARAGKRLRTPEEMEKSQEQAKKLRADALKVQAEKAGRDYYEPGQGFVSRFAREVRHAVTGRLLEPNVLEVTSDQKRQIQYWENPGSPGRPHFGAAIGLMLFVFSSLASLRITGRSLGGLIYPQRRD